MRVLTCMSVIYALASTSFAYPSDPEHPGLWPPPDGEKEWNLFNILGYGLTQFLGPIEDAIQDINEQDKSELIDSRSPSMPLSVVELSKPASVTVARHATVSTARKTGVQNNTPTSNTNSHNCAFEHQLRTSSTTKSVTTATPVVDESGSKTASSISASRVATSSFPPPLSQDGRSWKDLLAEVERAFNATIEAARSGELFKSTTFYDQNSTHSDVAQIRDSLHKIIDNVNEFIFNLLPEEKQVSHGRNRPSKPKVTPSTTTDLPYHGQTQWIVELILSSLLSASTSTPTPTQALPSSSSSAAKSTATDRRFPVAKRRLGEEDVSDLAPRHGMPGQWSFFFHFQDDGPSTRLIANHFGVKCQGMPGGKRFVTSFEWEDGMFVRGYRLYEDRQCTKPVSAGGDGTFYPRSVVLNKEVAAYMVY